MGKNSRNNSRKNSTKILASVALVAGAAVVAGLGTFGAWTSSTAAEQQVDAGKIELTDDKNGTLSAPVADVLPGDTIDRTITLTRAEDSEKFASVALNRAAPVSSELVTDTNGLKVTIDLVNDGQGAVNLVNNQPLVGNTDNLTQVTQLLNNGQDAKLRIRFSLPENAPNTLQGKSATAKFTFTALQRAGQAR